MADATETLGRELRRELITLLDGGQAHAKFEDAAKGFPAALRSVVPTGLPYSAWQIVEHMRITQRDILDFSDNSDGSYRKIKWPDDYWPKTTEPPDEGAWDRSLMEIRADRKAFDKLLHDADDAKLVKVFPWGDRQTLLHEALLIADHNAYHTGELVVVRRLLGAWK